MTHKQVLELMKTKSNGVVYGSHSWNIVDWASETTVILSSRDSNGDHIIAPISELK